MEAGKKLSNCCFFHLYLIATILIVVLFHTAQYSFGNHFLNAYNRIVRGLDKPLEQNEPPATLMERVHQQSNKIISPLFSVNSIRCIVYMRRRDGRLGNRMFMIASAYGVARLHWCHLYLSTDVINDVKSFFRLDFSSLLLSTKDFERATNSSLGGKHTNFIRKHVECQYIKEMARPNAIKRGQVVEITGAWQSYLNFIHYRDEIRGRVFSALPTVLQRIVEFFVQTFEQKFQLFPALSTNDYQKLKEDVANFNNKTWIGVHIRRTDFVQHGSSSSDEYLFNATGFFQEKYPNAYFIVASDDKSYVRNLFANRSNFMITPNTFSVGEDLFTLSVCQHSILTGGSFSWWSAFLASGEVIHDIIYPSGCPQREHYYPPWFLLDGSVRGEMGSIKAHR